MKGKAAAEPPGTFSLLLKEICKSDPNSSLFASCPIVCKALRNQALAYLLYFLKFFHFHTLLTMLAPSLFFQYPKISGSLSSLVPLPKILFHQFLAWLAPSHHAGLEFCFRTSLAHSIMSYLLFNSNHNLKLLFLCVFSC